MFDLVLTGGTVIDGTAAPRRRADVGVTGERITAVADDLSAADAHHRIDATGRIVTPGFIDVHNHSDGWLRKIPNLVPKTAQGFTTEVIMADGISYAPVDEDTAPQWLYYMRGLNALLFEEYDGWRSLGEYMAGLDRRMAQNAMTHIPYANIKTMACGWGRAVPDDYQMDLMRAGVERGMAEGAVGVSFGIDYPSQCFSTTDEMVEACAPMSPHGLYVTHVRYKKGTLAGVQEAVEIGRRANVPVHISHFKGTTPQQIDELLTYVDGTARNEVSFSFDVYPYLPGSTLLNFLLPHEVWKDGPLGVLPKLRDPRLRREFARGALRTTPLENVHIAWLPGRDNARHIGKLLSDYVTQVGKAPEDALCDLLIEENLAVLLVFHHGDDDLIGDFLAHDCYMMGTDGIYFPDGRVHPRLYGSAPRLLGPCVRDARLFCLEEAVAKMSDRPARRFGCAERGQVREGWFADLVVFDADSVADRATFDDPHQLPVGIDHVFVNGAAVIADGAAVPELPDPLPGRTLTFQP